MFLSHRILHPPHLMRPFCRREKVQQTILGCDRCQSTDDRFCDGIYLMRNPCVIRGIVCFGDNLSVPRHQQTVEPTARSCTRRRENTRCPEINHLSEFLRIHALLLRGARLPFLGRPDWLYHILSTWSSAAN